MFFEGPGMAPCEDYKEEVLKSGARQAKIGGMRPCILLYGEPDRNNVAVKNVIREDRKRKPDVFLYVGTRLAVDGMRKLADDICKLAKVRIWISREEPPTDTQWNYKYKGDCDDLALVYSRCRSDSS